MPLLITDPVDIELDSSGDLVIDSGLRFVSGLRGVTQLITIALQSFKGEWFLDLDHGVPYFQEILGRPFNQSKIARHMRKAIRSVEGVSEILNLELEFAAATRTLTVTWEVRTVWGDTGGRETVIGALT